LTLHDMLAGEELFVNMTEVYTIAIVALKMMFCSLYIQQFHFY